MVYPDESWLKNISKWLLICCHVDFWIKRILYFFNNLHLRDSVQPHRSIKESSMMMPPHFLGIECSTKLGNTQISRDFSTFIGIKKSHNECQSFRRRRQICNCFPEEYDNSTPSATFHHNAEASFKSFRLCKTFPSDDDPFRCLCLPSYYERLSKYLRTFYGSSTSSEVEARLGWRNVFWFWKAFRV